MDLKVYHIYFFRTIYVGIPYEDDDYREGNDFDEDRPNDVRDMRPYDHHSGGGRFNQLHDMNRQTHFDVGGGRDPPLDYGFRGFNQQHPKPNPVQLQPQLQSAQPQQPQQQPQQPQQPQPHQQVGLAGYDGGRASAFGYNPYGQYTYNPYYRPGHYGWNRPAQTADPWRGSSYGLGFPFNLLGLGGNSYRPWWSGNRFGLFF